MRLATAMLTRMLDLAAKGGTVSSITPQNWLFLGSYKLLREDVLRTRSFNLICALGSRAFETISGEVVNTSIVSISASAPREDTTFSAIDVNEVENSVKKGRAIADCAIATLLQKRQLANPDFIITLKERTVQTYLSSFADCYQGTSTGDNERCLRMFWEHQRLNYDKWELFAGPPSGISEYSGLTDTICWKSRVWCYWSRNKRGQGFQEARNDIWSNE
jgi:hypothetical protein